MGASAAYWVGSQADAGLGNEIALVGSIGTYCVLEDDTKCRRRSASS
jgi:ClpP class serine protease